ncbi:MAG: pimeloyl-ACP methyl ester carboxylesterase [Cognaticolwellia sp.]|jgi:pimeloyl-ACP methyl ester carboxylesterase
MTHNKTPQVSRHTVTVGDLELSYLEAGSGPPVLLLHGWPTNAELWRTALPHIAHTHRAIALDLPGFGQSSKPLDVRYSFRFYQQVLQDFLTQLGLSRVGLVLHDLGGPVGLYWAVHHPEQVRELVLLNTLVFPELSWAVKAFVVSTYLPGVRGLLSSPWGVERSIAVGLQNQARLTKEVAERYREPFESTAARKALLKAGQGLHPKGFETIAQGLPHLVDRPALLLYGEGDRILPDVAQTMERVAAILPQAQLQSIAGCGHFLQEDRPQEVAQILGAFFGSVA